MPNTIILINENQKLETWFFANGITAPLLLKTWPNVKQISNNQCWKELLTKLIIVKYGL